MKKSTQVAIGGLSAAICLLLMFMTGLVPFSSYMFPALAGIILVAAAEENGVKAALTVFAVTSLLALMIVPDRSAVMMFILLLGYYPILRPSFQRLPRLIRVVAKFLFFNLMIVVFYYIMKYVFMIPDMLEGWGEFGKYTMYFAFALANFTFCMYDFLLAQVTFLYANWFRPKILRKIV